MRHIFFIEKTVWKIWEQFWIIDINTHAPRGYIYGEIHFGVLDVHVRKDSNGDNSKTENTSK